MRWPANSESGCRDGQDGSADEWLPQATLLISSNDEKHGSQSAMMIPKQFVDLANAVALRDAGIVSETLLEQHTRRWTAFGDTTLGDHLVQCGAIDSEKLEDLSQVVDRLIQQIAQMRSLSPSAAELDSQDTIALIDPDGRVASILWLAGGMPTQAKQLEDRQINVKYTLLRKLGQGGLGTVWLARDENLNRYVAVKELNTRTANTASTLEHFRREAEITGRLEHPCIVPVYQFGRDEQTGKAFYAMRFLGRRTLEDAIKEYHEQDDSSGDKKVSLHRLLSAFLNVCHAVGYAHAQKIIHRDLKPANVALDEFGQVTLLDWGLSKVNDETGLYEVGGAHRTG